MSLLLNFSATGIQEVWGDDSEEDQHDTSFVVWRPVSRTVVFSMLLSRQAGEWGVVDYVDFAQGDSLARSFDTTALLISLIKGSSWVLVFSLHLDMEPSKDMSKFIGLVLAVASHLIESDEIETTPLLQVLELVVR